MIVPRKVEPVPSVAELPICQKTLQACAPFDQVDLLPDAVVSVEPAWKTKTAFGLPPRVERERAGQADRRGGVVDARRQRLSAEVGGDRRGRPLACGVVVRGDEIRLRLLRDGVAGVVRPVDGQRARAGDRRRRERAEVAVERGRAGVRDAGTGEDREAVGGAERHGGRRCLGAADERDEQSGGEQRCESCNRARRACAQRLAPRQVRGKLHDGSSELGERSRRPRIAGQPAPTCSAEGGSCTAPINEAP